MKPELNAALSAKLLVLADDELILAHRNSEWCGHAPILEEDIAFANIALDELGHATVWYQILADLQGRDRETYPDELVYRRAPSDYRCAQFVELPKGDWAFSMLRQYMIDLAEKIRLEALLQSDYQPLAEAAAKMRAEEIYHFRHTSAWVRRLGLGTPESNRRMQNALDALWAYAFQLFQPIRDEGLLVEAGYLPDPTALGDSWLAQINVFLGESGLVLPGAIPQPLPREVHTEYLAPLLADLQSVARLDYEARW